MCPVGGALFRVWGESAEETFWSAMRNEWHTIGFWFCVPACIETNVTLEQTMRAQREEVEVWLYSFFNLGPRSGVGSQPHASGALLPGRRPGAHGTGGWGKCQGRSGRVRKSSHSQGFDPRTVQAVASRCTDWAIAAISQNLQLSLLH